MLSRGNWECIEYYGQVYLSKSVVVILDIWMGYIGVPSRDARWDGLGW